MAWDTDSIVDRRRLKRRLVLWRTAAIVAAAGLAVILVGRLTGTAGDDARVARIAVTGVIVEDRDREAALARVAAEPDVKALIVHINSPGGTTFGGEALYRGLRRVAEKKPVVAVIGTVGASGGYMAALAADRILALETSITGSIGVLWQTAEFSRLLDRLGVSAESITSGPLKAEPSPFKPLSERARQAAQDLVDETHAWFVDLVAERRGLPRDRAAALADGRVYSGRAAQAAGLIDDIGGEAAARAWLASARDIDRDLPVVDLDYGDEPPLLRRVLDRLLGKSFLPERVTLDGLMSVWHPGG